jgi:hypothetical protein
MGYASLYGQTAKKTRSEMAQDEILGRGEGFNMGEK